MKRFFFILFVYKWNRRKNKRKNFRPRNIVYSTNESEDEEKVGGGDNSPMDLSVVRPNLDSDSGMTNKKKVL